jgi:tetratricopeptide (TPR) repeat protein
MRVVTLSAVIFVFVCTSSMAETAEQVFKRASPSVVVVYVSDTHGTAVALGSGVVVRPGAVVTNCHVVNAGGPRAELAVTYAGKTFSAGIRYYDGDRDMCELSVPNLRARPATVGNSRSLQVGQTVYAIGAPEGLELTLSQGLISGLRLIDGLRYIQTTASISPGSSGGGLFDADGRLVGFTTFHLKDGQNLNFALPVDWISRLPQRARAEALAKLAAWAKERANWLTQAVALENKSDWQGLLKLAQDWTAGEPWDELAWFALGEAYDNLGQYSKAVSALQEGIRLKPDDEDAWRSLSDAYVSVKDFDNASDAAQHAIKLKPSDAEAWRFLGVAYGCEGPAPQVEACGKAVAAYKQAIALQPGNANAWFDLAFAYYESGQHAEFAEAYKKLDELDPKRAALLLQLAPPSGDSPTDEGVANTRCAAGQHWVTTSYGGYCGGGAVAQSLAPADENAIGGGAASGRCTVGQRWVATSYGGYCGGETTPQSAVPTQAAVPGAVVWGEDSPSGAVSLRLQDPLTGFTINRINVEFAEVSSQVSYSDTRAGWEAYSVFAVATIKVTNTGDSPIQVEGTTQTLASPPEKFFLKSQIGCPYFAYWSAPRKKGTEPVSAEVKGTIAPHASQDFSVLMWIHISGSGVPDNAPDASNYIGAPVPARYSIRVNGVDFVFPAKIPTQYTGDYTCRPVH